MNELPEKTFFSFLRKWFLSGVLFLLPIAVTYWLLSTLIGWAQGYARPIVNQIFENLTAEKGHSVPDFFVALISLISALIFVIVVGWLANIYMGKKLLGWVDRFLLKVPFVRSIYGGTKQIMDAFSIQSNGSFKRVVLIEYPRRGSWGIAFVTNENLEQTAMVMGKPLIAVFLPSTPNPTTGFLLYLEPKDVWILDLDVESAVKLIVSGGLVSPNRITDPPRNFQDTIDERARLAHAAKLAAHVEEPDQPVNSPLQ